MRNRMNQKKKPSRVWRRAASMALLATLLLGGISVAWAGAEVPRGEMIAEVAYEEIRAVSGGMVAVKQDGKWGYLAIGRVSGIDPAFKDCSDFSEGAAAVLEGRLWYYIDADGGPLCDPKWEEARAFSEGYAAVKKGGKWGLIDHHFNLVLPCAYETLGDVAGGVAAVKQGKLWGAMDPMGNQVIAPLYTQEFSLREGYAAVFTGKETGGVIDATGKYLLRVGQDGWKPGTYTGGGCVLTNAKTGRYAVLTGEGKVITDTAWLEVREYAEGLAAVRTAEGYGFINTAGTLVIPAAYEDVAAFSDGLCAVKQGGEWGYIDTEGNEAYPCELAEAGPFSGDSALVATEDGAALLYRDGMLDRTLTGAVSNHIGLILLESDGAYGLYYDGVTSRAGMFFAGASKESLATLIAAQEFGLLGSLGSDVDYSEHITRERFCALVMAFYDRVSSPRQESISNPFTDTNDIAIIRAQALGIVQGRTESTFEPELPITREELCVMLMRLSDVLEFTPKSIKTVNAADATEVRAFARTAVRKMLDAGVVSADRDGRFRPGREVTVEQAVDALWKLANATPA